MADILVGSEAINRVSTASTVNRTVINLNNPASVDTNLTEVKIYAAADISQAYVAVFSDNGGGSFTGKNRISLGTITAGQVNSFEVDLDILEGEFIGLFGGSGSLDTVYSGGAGGYYASGDHTADTTSYTTLPNAIISIQGIGAGEDVGGGDFMMVL